MYGKSLHMEGFRVTDTYALPSVVATTFLFFFSLGVYVVLLLPFFPTRWNKAQKDGAMQMDENVPASKPMIIGNANILISLTPIIATIKIIINVVIVVLIERNNVSLIDLFAICSGVMFLENTERMFSRTRSKTIIELLIE